MITKKRKAQSHKRTQRFILGNPHGEENPAKLPLYKMCKKKTKKGCPPPSVFSLSLPYALHK